LLQQHVAALEAMATAVNAGDARRYARLYAPEAIITIIGGDVLRGRDAIERYEVDLLRQFPGARLAFYSLWPSGDAAVVHYGVSGKTPDGRAMGHEGLLFYRFLPSGLIIEERRYNDSLTPMAQLGMLGDGPHRAPPSLPDKMEVYAARNAAAEARNVALVKSLLDAWEAKREAQVLEALAEQAIVDDLFLPRPFSARPGARDWLAAWSAASKLQSELSSIFAAGDFVFAESVVRGRLTGRLGPVRASDAGFTVHRAYMAEITNGKVRRLAAFTNGKELAEAVGQWPPVSK